MRLWTVTEFDRWAELPDAADRVSGDDGPVVVVDLDSAAGPAPPAPGVVPVVVVGVTAQSGPAPAFVDVVVGPDELPAVLAGVRAHPQAATALVLLLRGRPGAGPLSTEDIGRGLIAESATYSMLQGGPEFAAWRASRPPRAVKKAGSTVRVERVDRHLRITLDRPEARNALNSAMRDELVEALSVAILDRDIERVTLAGSGPAFGAGGDLDEFGARLDPVSAHLIRLHRSPAWLLHRLADRLTAELHGACYGSGIELPAVASRVTATPDTRIALPELGLGLIPGAGGTVSLPGRIGRHRTAWLALTGASIDARTALAWGLVDAIIDHNGQ